MNKWTIAAITVALVAIAVAVCFLRPQSKTDEVISAIENSVEESQTRADNIVAETKKKEVSARVESRKSAYSLSDDELCDAINEMLRGFRQGQ